jgi:hypothetical protein
MNERIKELAGQADNYAYKMNPEEDSYGRPANPRKFQQERDAKFAELIVLECSTHIYSRALRSGGACTVVGEAGIWLAKDLKQNFGVEE